jgi:hypothetical protein
VEVWRDEPGQRVKLTKQERQGDDAEYF